MERIVYVRLGTLLVLILCVVGIYIGPLLFAPASTPYLRVTFLDVGQGDAILIETPDGVQVLIDGGPSASVLSALAKRLSFFDTTLDMVVGTHQDLDHIAGLIDVLDRYQVATILMTEGEGGSGAARMFVDSTQAETDNIVFARAGQTFILGASTTLTILSPADNPAQLETNTGSIVALLQYGETSFMLTGDAPQGIEEYIVSQYGTQLESDVLKLGHHGSDTSSGEVFLQTVSPRWAVVSAGADNRYGHPHPDVLERVRTHTNARVVSTAEEGNLTFYSDGVEVWME